jgi:hypothetical protein
MWRARAALAVLVLTAPGLAAAEAPQGHGVWDRQGQTTSQPTKRGTTDFETPRQQEPAKKQPTTKQGPPSQPTPVPTPRIRTDANGWPVLLPPTTQTPTAQTPTTQTPTTQTPTAQTPTTQTPTAQTPTAQTPTTQTPTTQTPTTQNQGVPPRGSTVQTPPVQTPAQVPTQVPAQPGGSGTPGTTPRGPLERPLADRSILRDVFQQVGRPEDLARLQCVVAWMTVKLFDHSGTELGELQVHHEADLRCTRDRLLFSRPSRGPDKIYGRDGRSVFAERYGMAWPSLVPKAREELELFGLLLRMPWAFANSDQFVVKSRDDDYIVNGRAMVCLRMERRPGATGMGVVGDSKPQDRFDLICSKSNLEPVEVHMRLEATGATTVVHLSDYKSYRGVHIPTRRVFMSENGYRLMEMRISRMDVCQDLPQAQFRPHQR